MKICQKTTRRIITTLFLVVQLSLPKVVSPSLPQCLFFFPRDDFLIQIVTQSHSYTRFNFFFYAAYQDLQKRSNATIYPHTMNIVPATFQGLHKFSKIMLYPRMFIVPDGCIIIAIWYLRKNHALLLTHPPQYSPVINISTNYITLLTVK